MTDEDTSGNEAPTTGADAPPESVWRVEQAADTASGYTFTNLSDHTAWQVVVHTDAGGSDQATEIPGHVSYADGAFRHDLSPGTYWLSWDTTVEMLKQRPDEPARPIPKTVAFTVPAGGTFELHRAPG